MAVFNLHQRATIEAATARIIPADRDPGALEAGVINYIENALAGYDVEKAPLYIEGVAELDRMASDSFAASDFLSLQPEQQDQILTALDNGRRSFFSVLLEHTMQGFYGDPSHGGNKDRASWKMIGFPGPSSPKGYEPPFGWYDEHVPDEFDPKKAKKREG